jgi:predicted NBD/HSP70 family sugar kinase
MLWGIDLGGTKIEGVVLSADGKHEVLARLRVPTESDKGYEHVLLQIKILLAQLTDTVGGSPDTLGIGTPGTLDPQTGLLKNSNSVVLNGKPFKHDIEATLSIKVNIANDANCFALAETKMGVVPEAAPEATVVFGVIMGTGVGGGVVVNGQVLAGRQGIAGEWGHNFLHESGGDCYCGKSGCVETIISGPALERYYHSLSGINKNLKEIVALAHAGDSAANLTLTRLTEYFGKGLSSVVNTLDPDVIVLGGGVGNIDLLYDEGLASLKRHIFNTAPDVLLVKPKLGDSAGVFGAAFLT